MSTIFGTSTFFKMLFLTGLKNETKMLNYFFLSFFLASLRMSFVKPKWLNLEVRQFFFVEVTY